MELPKKQAPVREMHKIVWILGGVFSLFALTFPTAIWRISQMEKFAGSHVKSFPLKGKLPHFNQRNFNSPSTINKKKT